MHRLLAFRLALMFITVNYSLLCTWSLLRTKLLQTIFELNLNLKLHQNFILILVLLYTFSFQ